MNNFPGVLLLDGNFFNSHNGINNFRGFEESYYKNEQFNRFNLNDIDKINLNHPFKILISYILLNKNKGNIKYINKLRINFDFDYFKLLDNFYRYNIAFDPNYHLVIEDKLFLYKNKENYYIILKKEKFLRPVYSVYFICLSDIDKGKKELTKLEKWKREVIKNKVNLKDQLSLINPYVYNNINLFYKSKDKKNHLSIDFYFSNEGIKLFLGEEFNNIYFLNKVIFIGLKNRFDDFNGYPEEDPDFLLSILENFDVKKLDKMKYPHPFKYLIETIYFYTKDYFGEDFDEFYNPIDNNNYENKSIDVLGDDCFKILDNYYRYGIVFNSKDVHQGNKLLIKEFNPGFYEVSELKNINHLPKGLEIINLDEIDNGEIELSEIEKWKRKIIIEKKSLKDKLVLLDPYNYDNFSIFYKLSQEDNIEKYHYKIDKYITVNELEKVKKINYKEKKICEDKIFEKYKEILK